MEHKAENPSSPWKAHLKAARSRRAGSTISTYYQPRRQGAVEGDHTSGSDVRRAQQEEIAYARQIKVLRHISRMPHHIHHGDLHSPISLYYTGEQIDPKYFLPQWHTSSHRLKMTLENPLAVVEYFHTLINIIIKAVFQKRVIRRPSPLLRHDRIPRMRDSTYSYHGMTCFMSNWCKTSFD